MDTLAPLRHRSRSQHSADHRSNASKSSRVQKSRRAHGPSAAVPSDAGSVASTIWSASGPKGRSTRAAKRTSFLADVLRGFERSGQQAFILPAILSFVYIVKLSVGLGSFSGEGKAPLYGDLEAQRNWLSVTLHRPIAEWYYYRLGHWGLDYPPLTAYHSLLMAFIMHHLSFSGSAVAALRDSGNVANQETIKVWMRHSVVISELVLWVPAVVAGWVGCVLNGRGHGVKRSQRTRAAAIYTILLQPANILIDNGHFQYNTVMLAFTLLAVVSFHLNKDCLGAFFFVCSLCFKQMSLYYAPAIFAYLLGKCVSLGPDAGLKLFFSLGLTTSSAFLLMFGPFLKHGAFLQSLHRIFPFARGLFEDKVANFWCTLNVVVKLRTIFSTTALTRIALLATLVAILPSMAAIFHATATAAPTKHKAPAAVSLLPYAMLASSLAFFLFSFQVHEKSILLPLLPATLLMASGEVGSAGQDVEWCSLFVNVAIFSMWPLLKKDGLGIQYLAVTLFWNYSLGLNPLDLPSSAVKLLSLFTYSIIATLHLLEMVSVPPAHLPDLFAVLNLILCAAVFGLVWLWSMKRLVEEGWAMSGSFSSTPSATPKALSPTDTTRQYERQAAQTQRDYLSAPRHQRELRPSSAGSSASRTRS